MQPFLDENFLLTNEMAELLYHRWAAPAPIYDFHCHIDPRDIGEDRRYENLTQLWLEEDHYKWRLMRSNGVPERYITGDATDREKFQKFAETLPRAVGNPLYHWCHMELKKYFGIHQCLRGDTAEEIWQETKRQLREERFSARQLIERSNVAVLCTTDDPCSDLRWHRCLRDENFTAAVYPGFRPDSALHVEKRGYAQYIEKLGEAVGRELCSAVDVANALTERMKYFQSFGCRTADQSMEYIPWRPITEREADGVFQKAMSGVAVTEEEMEGYQTWLLLRCAGEYDRLGLVMQLHFGCVRDPNTKAMAATGPDGGFDCISDRNSCTALRCFLDALEKEGCLPKTIVYNLNPSDNGWLDALVPAFPGEGIRGKVQHGPAWWFNDHRDGIRAHLTGLAASGVLGSFVGMLTDSRSLLSYVRHEYFRRVLCDFIGTLVENGLYPGDIHTLGGLVEDICWNNAREYFDTKNP